MSESPGASADYFGQLILVSSFLVGLFAQPFWSDFLLSGSGSI
jgi:hypothetical protein